MTHVSRVSKGKVGCRPALLGADAREVWRRRPEKAGT